MIFKFVMTWLKHYGLRLIDEETYIIYDLDDTYLAFLWNQYLDEVPEKLDRE